MTTNKNNFLYGSIKWLKNLAYEKSKYNGAYTSFESKTPIE